MANNRSSHIETLPSLIGDFTYVLDNKDRINIPSTFRRDIQERNRFLIRHDRNFTVTDDCLYYGTTPLLAAELERGVLDIVHDMLVYNLLRRKRDEQRSRKKELTGNGELENFPIYMYQTGDSEIFVCGYADFTIISGEKGSNIRPLYKHPLDNQGRIPIPEEVKRQLGLEDRVRFVGYDNKIKLERPQPTL